MSARLGQRGRWPKEVTHGVTEGARAVPLPELNPYAPPASELVEPARPPQPEELATTNQRFANYVLDSIGYLVFSFLIGLVLALADPGLIERFNDFAFGLAVVSLYYVSSESIFGRSPAKFITRTKVVSEHGGPPGLGRVIGRTAVRMVPFEVFSFLGGDGHPVGWHDSWTKTRVVQTRVPPRTLAQREVW